jgi:hypothetical protein
MKANDALIKAIEGLLSAVDVEPFGFLSHMATLDGRVAWYDKMVHTREALRIELMKLKEV